ncbi:hypothetical protein BDZ89DRAFT_761076 [Hymenopellis radicata]|nr:hypothetical protein BDZ89DRAFT_761076 [Hymenopellis radicata]
MGACQVSIPRFRMQSTLVLVFRCRVFHFSFGPYLYIPFSTAFLLYHILISSLHLPICHIYHPVFGFAYNRPRFLKPSPTRAYGKFPRLL